ncbi:PD-(D/E)XK nuclease family protein [Thiospirillum jenense]|uniref:DUF3782 domain-containing protein n=1 Tax=Thiospirillum jenense TaxID=1653858 RepID=A0A839HFN7_9GAMM|nr:DUF3782 domain-containing protein [Thiospirillum jenense]MBB1126166.1 DUF3782 domain-containing protein [Thiospirillum jenense]
MVNQKRDNTEFKLLHEKSEKSNRRITAMGARWGIQSERSFRNALTGIFQRHFDVEVINYTGYDETGEVFGYPENIELDIIIKNGLLLICELKSSVDRAALYTFKRKALYYERQQQRTANRLLVISPMISERARQAANKLGIECYDDALDVAQI